MAHLIETGKLTMNDVKKPKGRFGSWKEKKRIMMPPYLPPVLSSLFNHLWQSTLIAAVAGMLTLLLRRNHAEARYWLWLVASVKFLIPFSVLVTLASRFRWSTAAAMQPAIFLTWCNRSVNPSRKRRRGSLLQQLTWQATRACSLPFWAARFLPCG